MTMTVCSTIKSDKLMQWRNYSLFINQPHIKSIEGSKDLDQ